MSTLGNKETVVDLLDSVPDLAVQSVSNAHRHYVVVESQGTEQARHVSQLVYGVDPDSLLTHTVDGNDAPIARAQRRPNSMEDSLLASG
jgi:hypothetical protein